MYSENKPRLKLRTDLFDNSRKHQFLSSEDENEDKVNSSEMREFLKNIVEITDLKDGSSPSEIDKPSKNSYIKDITSKKMSPKIRKVKIGFLKKKILHKAIKRMNLVNSQFEIVRSDITSEKDHVHEDIIPSLCTQSESSVEPEIDNMEAQEEVRKNLKLQLSSLRNRKKTDCLIETVCKKVSSIGDLKINYKKQLLDKEKLPNVSLPSDTAQFKNSMIVQEISTSDNTQTSSKKENSLFSLSKETNFMIVDVQGGVTFQDDDKSAKDLEQEKDIQSDTIKLTKTNDITKIKGWKNKKFDLDQKNEVSADNVSSNSVMEKSKPSTIEENNTSSEKILPVEENSNEELSPFVSNTLEEFLTENSTLNISYKIPKLGAEESFKEKKYKHVVLPKTSDPPALAESEKKDKPKGLKAKTLAEKRRMLEGKMPKKRPIFKEENKVSKTSYVSFNGQILYIPSTSTNTCLAEIKSKPKRFSDQNYRKTETDEFDTPRKLSLLNLWKKQRKSVTYKPGPLSKKQELQNVESLLEWDTMVQELPQVQLKVIPEIGKPISPHLVHLLPKFGPVVGNDHIEFALSTMYNKFGKQTKKGFVLPVPYANNQKSILVRKRRRENNINLLYDIKPEKNSVASVINDLLNYVENKANEDSIILDAEPYKEDELIANQTTSPINESTITDDNLALKNSKRRRLNAELHRLNCKVVSVTVDEAETTSPDCKKPYCKFGCVCRSLECIPRLPLHCSNISCMFDCECSTNEEASQTEEISLLSSDTVTRIEDQAKKYLAKEEKEFTQTIIHANDNTILIPSSGRSKTKRVKRLPKRFSDYLEDFNLDQPIISANESTKRLQHIENYNCFIELEKLDLQTVVPLCLDHNCYNCSCLVVSNTQSKKNVIDQESKFEEKVPPIKIKRRRISMIEKDYKSLENLQSSGETANFDLFENIIVQEERKKKRKEGCARVCGVHPEFVAGNGEKVNSDLFENSTVQEEKKKKRKDGCARVCGVHPEFVARNEIPFYKKKLKVRLRNMENLCSIDVSSLPNVNYTEPHTDLIDVTTPLTIRGSDRLKLILTDNSRHKRKQVLKVRDDVDSVIFQQRKIIKKFKRKSLEETEEINERQAEHMPYKSIFDGEIVIPTNENKEFVKKLGVKSVAPYMRLLPWNDLLRNYYNSKIKIWCSQEKNDKLIINTSDKVAPEGYIEIAKSHRKNGIMTWILNKELPKQTPGELVHLILSPNNEHFEISGICLKNIPISTDNKKNLNNSNEEFKNSKMIDQEPKKQTVEVVNESHSNFLEHKNVNNELNVLCMTQQVYQPQYYYLEPSCEKMCDENFPLSVELPIIRPHLRWRMLFLNSNFSFLSFINNKYSIKYTDLMHILKKAQNHNKTISLQSMQLSSGYSQKNYGIYAVPKFRDRLFIGPYKLDEDHGLETLRYLRQSLVSTSTFEMAQGGSNPNNKKAVWLVTKVGKVRDKECSSLNSNLLVPDIVMDTSCSAKNPINITEHSEKVEKAKSQYAELIPISTKSVDECLDTKNSENETHDLQKITDHSNLFESCKTFISSMDLEEKASVNFPQFILFNGKKMKPQDYNRFIMTNIPHFGYLGAIQDEQSKTIDVDWPFARKVLRFPNVTAATEFLKRRFANLLLPVPVSFQIQLILLREIDFINNSPVDANILSGTHICGEFGVMDSRKLTPSLAETLGTTQEEVLKRLAKRAQYLGGLEIRKLQKQEKMLVEMKKDLIIQKQKNLAKYMELLMILPEQKRLESYNKFRHQFNGRSLSSMTEKGESKDVKMEDIECIEITDSDSDLETSSLLTEPTQITKAVQTTVSPKKSLVMKSVLKSNISPQPQPSQSDRASTKSVESLKFLKTSTGKLILLRDTCVVPSPPVTTMRRIITNNRVIGTEKTNCDSLLKIIKNPTELNTKNVNPESDEND
ncbi:hypothetical protein HHI36_010384 [Cryptolaemus montrouzieri]|uniref:MGA conserved domain-containing protein n=1 Tax=Cryptolaemus montrouzieri TaxID=559131 RepID=A0ABD2MJB3_9CUCU